MIDGKISSVDTDPAGSVLTEAALAGATTITLGLTLDFPVDGGQVIIEGTDVPLTYLTVDHDTDQMTLLDPLVADLEIDTQVRLYPYAETKIASVDLSDEGDALQVIVPHTLSALLDDGQRDPDNRETVTIAELGVGHWVMTDIIGREPQLSGPVADAIGSDGVPPTESPTPDVIGGIGAIYVRWTGVNNPDPVTYEVHVALVPDFIPNPATLVATTDATSITVRTLPDASPLAYDLTYYFKIVATDHDGVAAASLPGSAMMVKITGPDIAADYVYAGNIVADQVNGGSFQGDIGLFGSIKTATSGARVELGPFGFVVYDSTGTPTTLLGSNGVSTFKGQVEASTLTVTNGMSVQGTNNELAQAGSLTLAAGVSASPNAPTVLNDYEVAPGWKTEGGSPWPTGYEFKDIHRFGTKWLVGARQVSNDQFFGRTFNDDGSFDAYYGVGWLGQQIQRCTLINSGMPLFAFRNTDRRIVAATHSVSGGATVNSISWDFASGQPPGTVEEGTVNYVSGWCRLSVPSSVGPASYLHSASTMDMRGQRVTARVRKVGSFTAGARIELRMRNDNAGEYILARIEGDDTDIHFQTYNGSAGSTKIALAPRPPDGYYWRMTESNGDAKLQTSPDGVTWTVVATITDHGLTDSDLASMTLSLIVDDVSDSVAVTGEFDDVTVGWGFLDYGDNIAWSDASNPPALGTDGTFIYAAERTSDSRIKIHQIHPRSPGRIVQTFTSGVSTDFGSFATPLVTVAWGNFDFGGARFVVTTGNSGDQFAAVFTLSGTTLTYQRNESFYVPGQGGSGYDGTIFQTMATDGTRRKHTTTTWTDVSEWSKTWYAATTWYDGDAVGGTHETTPSPRMGFSYRKRSRYTVTSGTIPDLGGVDDPDRIRIYASSSISGTLYLQTTTAVGINSAILNTATFSGTVAPVSNNFPNAIAARIKNVLETLIISGDGSITAVTGTFSGALSAGPTTVSSLTITSRQAPLQVNGPNVDYDTVVAQTDVPQLTATVVSPSTSAIFKVIADLSVGAASTGNFTAYLAYQTTSTTFTVDAKIIRYVEEGGAGNRHPLSRTWHITGLTGSRVIKLQANSATAAGHTLYAGQCSISIEQIW